MLNLGVLQQHVREAVLGRAQLSEGVCDCTGTPVLALHQCLSPTGAQCCCTCREKGLKHSPSQGHLWTAELSLCGIGSSDPQDLGQFL